MLSFFKDQSVNDRDMLSALRRLLSCNLNRHRPIRSQVTWDHRSYVGTCKDCGEPIRRISHRKWRLDTHAPL